MNLSDKIKSGITQLSIKKIRNNIAQDVTDYIAIESPLQIEIYGKPISITMRTPGDDTALALGFLFTEGIFHDFNDIADIVQKEENVINIIPEDTFTLTLESMDRNFYTTSSCGVCGKASVENIIIKSKYMPVKMAVDLSAKTLITLQEKLLNVQSSFEITGGIHACALFSPDGKYLFHSEDVGRHNALDKLIGHALMAGKLPLTEHILLLSGRASFELVQKAAMAGIPAIVSVGAPSSLAINLAKENKQTLVGFLKKTGFNIYSQPERIKI